MYVPFKRKNSSKKQKINIDIAKINSKSESDTVLINSALEIEKTNLESESNVEETSLQSESDTVLINSPLEIEKTNLESESDSTKLINILSQNVNENVVLPNICYNKNIITYPMLEQIGRETTDIDFLNHLASPEINILKKLTHERILVCPEHPQNFTLTPHHCCVSCASTDISKLHLFEHKVCGYLAESHQFKEKLIDGIFCCPSCNKKINNLKDEIRVAGNWCKCNTCKTKFDDCKVKLHCREFDHDFDISHAEVYPVPSFEIIDKIDVLPNNEIIDKTDDLPNNEIENKTEELSNSESHIISDIEKLLASNEFFTEADANVKGKSGIEHAVSLYGSNPNGQSILLFIEMSGAEIDESKVNDIIKKANDISPTTTILVATPSISKSAEELISDNNILFVEGTKSEKILPIIENLCTVFFP